MTDISLTDIIIDQDKIKDIFLSSEKRFNPPVVSLDEQIRNNAKIIAETRQMLIEHPEMANALKISLHSSLNLQREFVLELARRQGIPSERDVLAIEVNAESEGFLSIPLENLLALTNSIGSLLHSIKDSFRKKRTKCHIDLSLKFAAPFAGSFGFFLVPQITMNTNRRKETNIQKTMNFTVESFVFSPLRRLLSASHDEESLKHIFTEMGASVASDYEKYLKVISRMNMSVSLYSSKIAFPLDKNLADSVLSKMALVCREPIEETYFGRIQGIDIVNNKRNIVFVADKTKIEASFDDSLFQDIHHLFNLTVEAFFDHKIVTNSITGKDKHDWHLKKILKIPEAEEESCSSE